MLALLAATPAAAREVAPQDGSPTEQCLVAAQGAGSAEGVPDGLMARIAQVESAQRQTDGVWRPWPWTIDADGADLAFVSRQQAVGWARTAPLRGVKLLDAGCLQVNLQAHPHAFASLDEAFDPAANARYAARFLNRLLAQTGSWPGATAGYHSLTPGIGDDYARKVLAIWGRPAPPAAPAAPVVAQSVAPSVAPSAWPTLPAGSSFAAAGAASARVIPLPGVGTPVVGRGLASYRAAPTRLAFAALPGRG